MVRLIDRLEMTIVVDWDVKPQIKQTIKIICKANQVANACVRVCVFLFTEELLAALHYLV